MAGKYKAVDISNQTVAVSSAPSKKDRHIATLEDKVDALELEVASLKKKLASKPKIDNSNYKAMYLKILPEIQLYWDSQHPF